MDSMPIVSFWQATDTIFYGSDFENYLQNELIDPDHYHLGEIPDRIKHTGIWNYVID